MKKKDRNILLFLDNAPCHIINQSLSNIKLVFFPPNTTSKCQPMDQGVIRAFKCHYRQKLVKHIIAQCSTARSADQVSVNVLDAVNWIDSSWKRIATSTIQNGFRAAGFVSASSTSSHLINDDVVAQSDLESNDSTAYLQDLDYLLSHLMVDDQRLTAAEFVDIDASVPAFNEWNDIEHPHDSVNLVPEDENDEEEIISMEKLSKFIRSIGNDPEASSIRNYSTASIA